MSLREEELRSPRPPAGPHTRDTIRRATGSSRPRSTFQAIAFDRPDRIARVVRQSPWLLNRPFREYIECEPRPDAWYPEPRHTPLAWAVAKNKPDAVRALLEEGAAQVPAPDGRTLVQVARDLGHEEAAALLEAAAWPPTA